MLWFKKKKEEGPKIWTITETHWLVDSENEDRFFKAFKEDLFENDDYDLPKRELIEDFEGEKVYRYEPYELPFKMDGLQVYSKIGDEWMRVGRVKKTADLNGELSLHLYPNIYKKVTEEDVEKHKGDHYFGLTVKKKKVMHEPN